MDLCFLKEKNVFEDNKDFQTTLMEYQLGMQILIIKYIIEDLEMKYNPNAGNL